MKAEARGTAQGVARFGGMNDDTARYRDFARRCRELAETAHESTANTLLDLANSYEELADEMEGRKAVEKPKAE